MSPSDVVAAAREEGPKETEITQEEKQKGGDRFAAVDSKAWQTLTRGWSEEEWGAFVLGEDRDGGGDSSSLHQTEGDSETTKRDIEKSKLQQQQQQEEREEEDAGTGVEERILPVMVFFDDGDRRTTVFDELSDEETLRREAEEDGLLGICIRKTKYIRGNRTRRRPPSSPPPARELLGRGWGLMKARIGDLKGRRRRQQERAFAALALSHASKCPNLQTLFLSKQPTDQRRRLDTITGHYK